MPSLEQEIIACFTDRGIRFHQHVADEQRFTRLDFGFGDPRQKRYFRFDAKEKRQPYNLQNWPDAGIPEEHLFILDDLAARKILAVAPNSGLVVRDNVRLRYYLFTVVDLFLMPKLRLNRPIAKEVQGLKGKWLVDLRHSHAGATLPDALAHIETYLDSREAILVKKWECYGDYVGEQIGQGGVVRQPGHWEKDIRETR